MTLSLCTNMFFAFRLSTLKKKVNSSNAIISTRVDSAVRETMHSIKKFKESGAREELIELQRSVQELAVVFSNWVELNKNGDGKEDPLFNVLSGIETLRNAAAHHLTNQYSMHNDQLTDIDKELLNKLYEQLDKFLLVYNNIETRLVSKKSIKGDGGLSQWGSGIEEISKLYRHSSIPNIHPKYIPLNAIEARVDEMFPEFYVLEKKRNIKEIVQIKEGVHYYEVSYYDDKEPLYILYIDAINGVLRHYEDHTDSIRTKIVFKDQALEIAKDFVDRFEGLDNVMEELSPIKDEVTNNTTYAFQFTPVIENVAIASDNVKVSVSSEGGKVIKYSSNFSNTSVPSVNMNVSKEDIEEGQVEHLQNMKYMGMAVVRSFYTEYKPILTYSYISTEKDQASRLYFDVATGHQVYEAYSVYKPVQNTTIDDNH